MDAKRHYCLSSFFEELLCAYAGIEGADTGSRKALNGIARQVKRLSDLYTRGTRRVHPGQCERETFLIPYLLYYLPVNAVKMFPVLDELFGEHKRRLAQKKTFSVLDLGCGPGTFCLAVLEYLSRRNLLGKSRGPSLTLHGVDISKSNVRAASELVNRYMQQQPSGDGRHQARFLQGSLSSHTLMKKNFSFRNRYDLIIVGNVASEMQGGTTAFSGRFFADILSDDGALILLEPGTRSGFRVLLNLRDRLLHGSSLYLYAPCLRQAPCPLAEHQWCHEKTYWKPTAVVEAVDSLLNFSKRKGLKYSYFTLLPKPKNVSERLAGKDREALWRVVSYCIAEKGQERLAVCNGEQRVMLRRLCRNASSSNRPFGLAQRGDIIQFTNVREQGPFLDVSHDSTVRLLNWDAVRGGRVTAG